MFEIIFVAVCIWIIFRRMKRNRDGQGVNGEKAQPNTPVPAPARNAKSPVRNAQGGTNAYGTAAGGAMGAGRTSAQPQETSRRAAKQKAAQDAVREAREDGNNTTAYLMEKAQEDAREHAREKFEEQKRLAASRGGLPVAERYLLGDSVPQGKRLVNCGYCGAENLIPMMPRTRYSCYFCRETL